MKILSGPEGDGLVTNAEVQAWLKEKNFEIDKRDLEKGAIRPPCSTASLARDIREYLEASPSGTQTVAQVKDLYGKLEKFKLSAPEKLMIANIRPEAYAHLTPLLVDVYSRFDEDEVYEMLEIINNTLPRRKKPSDDGVERKQPGNKGTSKYSEERDENLAEGEEVPAQAPVDATALDISSMAVSRGRASAGGTVGKDVGAIPSGRDATILDYSSAMQTSQGAAGQTRSQPSKGSTAIEENVSKSQEEEAAVADCTILDYTALKKP